MVITCPHALGLAVPLVVAVSTAIAARHGLLIRNRVAFEEARRIQAVIFDKTGTLTEGRFGVTDRLVVDSSIGEDALLKLAAAVEARSEHPIARGIVASVPGVLPAVEGFLAITGKGAQGRVEGREIKVVSPGFLQENGIDCSTRGSSVCPLKARPSSSSSSTVAPRARSLWPTSSGRSRKSYRRLKSMRQVLMLTDSRSSPSGGRRAGLDDYFAEVLPQDKALKVRGPERDSSWPCRRRRQRRPASPKPTSASPSAPPTSLSADISRPSDPLDAAAISLPGDLSQMSRISPATLQRVAIPSPGALSRLLCRLAPS